jgi:hypothetical protein
MVGKRQLRITVAGVVSAFAYTSSHGATRLFGSRHVLRVIAACGLSYIQMSI